MVYIPDESRLSLPALHYLLTPEGRDLLTRADEVRESTPAEIARLRKNATAEQVHAALITAEVRRKVAGPKGKFPEIADRFFAPPEALEQATGLAIARHKARNFGRLAYADNIVIVDFCAGIGGDALGFASVAPAVAIELSPVRAWCLEQNAAALGVQIEVIQDDLLKILPTLKDHLADRYPGRHPVFHIDPARRSGGKRSHAFADIIPGPDVISTLIAQFPAGMVKLSPGVDFDELPRGVVEIISNSRQAVQTVLWTGELNSDLILPPPAPMTRIASIVPPEGPGRSYFASPSPPAAPQPPQSYLYEVDPAVHRAGIAGKVTGGFGLVPINTDGGYVTGSQLLHEPSLMAAFEHIATVPYRDIRKALAALPAGNPGPVEVKTRGGLDIDPDKLQKEFTKLAPSACTVLIYRTNEGITASVAKRVRDA